MRLRLDGPPMGLSADVTASCVAYSMPSAICQTRKCGENTTIKFACARNRGNGYVACYRNCADQGDCKAGGSVLRPNAGCTSRAALRGASLRVCQA